MSLLMILAKELDLFPGSSDFLLFEEEPVVLFFSNFGTRLARLDLVV